MQTESDLVTPASTHQPNKSMKAKILPISLTCIVGAIGFMIGQKSSAPTNSASDSAALSSDRASNLSASSTTSATRAASSSRNSESATTKTAANISKGDPLTRLEEIKNIHDPLDRARMWLQFVDSLSAEEFEGVVAAFRADGSSQTNMGDYALLLNAWAKVNPVAALDYAKANTSNPFARQTILATWAANDPNSAIAWAKGNHQGDGPNPWMVGVIRGLAFQDPELASSLLKEMPRSVERGQALDSLLPALFKQGADSARSWATSITDEALREGAIMRIAERTLNSDPEGTADWLLANPSEATNRRMDDALSAMARKDESSALAYYNQLPAGDARSNALRGLVNHIAQEDPAKAVALMDQHSSDVNNRVVEQFVWYSFRKDPNTAVSSIARINNVEERDRMYSRTIEWWMGRDEQAAMKWVSGNTLPENVINRLNRSIEQRQQRDN